MYLTETFFGSIPRIMSTISVALLAISVGIAGWHYEYGTQHTVTFTITRLDDQATRNGHQYLIDTARGNVLKDADSWLHGRPTRQMSGRGSAPGRPGAAPSTATGCRCSPPTTTSLTAAS